MAEHINEGGDMDMMLEFTAASDHTRAAIKDALMTVLPNLQHRYSTQSADFQSPALPGMDLRIKQRESIICASEDECPSQSLDMVMRYLGKVQIGNTDVSLLTDEPESYVFGSEMGADLEQALFLYKQALLDASLPEAVTRLIKLFVHYLDAATASDTDKAREAEAMVSQEFDVVYHGVRKLMKQRKVPTDFRSGGYYADIDGVRVTVGIFGVVDANGETELTNNSISDEGIIYSIDCPGDFCYHVSDTATGWQDNFIDLTTDGEEILPVLTDEQVANSPYTVAKMSPAAFANYMSSYEERAQRFGEAFVQPSELFMLVRNGEILDIFETTQEAQEVAHQRCAEDVAIAMGLRSLTEARARRVLRALQPGAA